MDLTNALALRQLTRLLPTSPRGLPDFAGLAKQGEPTEPADGGSLDWLSPQAASPVGIAEAARAILARCDLTDISPREFSEMIQQLYKIGALSDAEFQDLALIRLDLDLDGVDPYDSIDLVDFYADKLRGLQQQFADADETARVLSANQPSPTAVRRRLEWLEKAAMIQADPDAAGLDTLA